MTHNTAPLRIAIVGGGWAGMAAAVRTVQAGHHVTVLEAARRLGGRARAMPLTLPDGSVRICSPENERRRAFSGKQTRIPG